LLGGILIKIGILILYTFCLFFLPNNQNNYYEIYFNRLETKYNNQDIIGVIEVENTNISEVIVKGEDNEYYLTHDLKNNYDIYGTVFMDYRNDLNDKKKLFFGHNIELGEAPFKQLEKYLEKDFFYDNNDIYLITKKGKKIYEVFSVMIVDESSNHMSLVYDNWNEYLHYLQNNSIYYKEVELNNDNIIILQTCNFKPRNTYILVIAKETE